MLQYLYLLVLAVAVSCGSKQIEHPALSSAHDSSVAVVATDTVETSFQFSSHAIDIANVNPDNKEVINEPFSLFENLRALQDHDAFEAQIINNKDTILSLPRGTRLQIPANAFSTAGGSVHTIDISVHEYYSLTDIISANLTTTTADNILETGGMIYISVSSGGEE